MPPLTLRELEEAHPPPEWDTCGWYIWGGEGEALPPGRHFLAADAAVDVWYDASLLDVR